MNRKVRAAVIGVGRAGDLPAERGGGFKIGYVHATNYRAHPEVELVAGADVNEENLAAWRQEFAVPGGYADHRELLADARPELVSICTYVGLHARMLEDCARAGVGTIFCEKPFLAAPAELELVRGLLAETGVKVAVAHIRRYQPIFRRMRELVQAGAIGRPLLYSASLPGWDLSEWGTHWFDIFRFFNDDAPVEWVMGQARVREERAYGHATEQHAVAYFSFAGGCKGLIDGGGDLAQPFPMILTGEDGELRLVDNETLRIVDATGAREERFPIAGAWDAMWGEAVDEVVAWARGGDEPTIGATNALQTAELNLAAYLSAVERDRVDLPLADLSLAEWPLEQLARAAA
ncbi:MAG TPA: Gfo/Idh/MocA family oxidoreductase [Gaiellaceae bacterium]|nr:Gfo/Idh/MocA family oxidoreductase [Gaiellaceae bacterium]